MFGFSGEHLILLTLVLLFFGPKKLPELGAFLGKTTRKFREGLAGIQEPPYRKISEETWKEEGKK